ncbi:MAG: M48 family metalloprotease [Phycisphaeraceae bacterium]|nr:MAG: M48 family metalloprotease [Phycisphaeraceae bacterium]
MKGRRRTGGGVLRGVLAAAAALGGLSTVGCTTNPTTGRTHFELFGLSREQEIALGAQEGPRFAAEFGGAAPSPELQAYVARIGRAMAAKTEGDYPTLPWEFTLLNSDVINAFALPGGKVYLSRGLAARMTNEAQLAAVIGHEIGHVTARHVSERMADANMTSLIIGAGATVAGDGYGQTVSEIGQQVGGVVLLKFGRDQESEADALGMRYMTRVDPPYNPRGAYQVMEILAAASAGGRSPEILSTHPYPETRMQRINEQLRGAYASMVSDPRFSLREAEFRRDFLAKLSALPAPPAARPRAMILGPGGVMAGVDLADASSWCLHCATGGGH